MVKPRDAGYRRDVRSANDDPRCLQQGSIIRYGNRQLEYNNP
jgi:hypothetical protein